MRNPIPLVCLIALCVVGVASADGGDDGPRVIPAVYYRGHVLVHYAARDYVHNQSGWYLICVRSVERGEVATVVFPVQAFLRLGHKNHFQSVFVRGPVLVYTFNKERTREFGDSSSDQVAYVSAERLLGGKWTPVHPNGDVISVQGVWPEMWGRRYQGLPDGKDYGLPEGEGLREPEGTELVHTAVAALGVRDLLAFDLLHVTEPPRGQRPPPPRLLVTRIVPEEKALDEESAAKLPLAIRGFSSTGRPEVHPAGEIASSFTGPFQAYVLGEDYYFVTKSGRVFRSPPAEPGKPRGMVAVSGPPAHGRLYLISDGHRDGVHFLVEQTRRGGRWEYRRLGPDPEREPLPNLKLGPDQSELEPAEVVRQLAQQLKHAGEIE